MKVIVSYMSEINRQILRNASIESLESCVAAFLLEYPFLSRQPVMTGLSQAEETFLIKGGGRWREYTESEPSDR